VYAYEITTYEAPMVVTRAFGAWKDDGLDYDQVMAHDGKILVHFLSNSFVSIASRHSRPVRTKRGSKGVMSKQRANQTYQGTYFRECDTYIETYN
jgi:hypothetical protein